MPVFVKTEALVLNAMRWRESSKIVHLLSADLGYFSVVAKGALRAKSPFRGALETLNHVEIVFSHREGRDLQTLTNITLLNAFMNIRDDLPKTATAFSILEVSRQLLRTHESVPDFFDYTVTLLASLNEHHRVSTRAYLLHFLFQISLVLGFGWQLKTCLHTGAPPRDFPVLLDYRAGGIVSHEHRKHKTASDVVLSRDLWQQLCLLAEAEVAVLPDVATPDFPTEPDAVEALRKHLEHHTDNRLSLKSLSWYSG